MVVLGGFAFLGQITIGLDDDLAAVHVNRLTSFTYLNAVLEAVELQTALVTVVFAGCCAGRRHRKAVGGASGGWRKPNLPPSRSLRSGNRPGRLHACKVSITEMSRIRRSGRVGEG